MKPKILSGYLSSAFYLTLLSMIMPLSAEEQKGVEIHLSEVELQEIFNNPKRSYVYVGREASNIADVMEEISKLDDNPNSLIHGLTDHIKKGFNIGNYDAVAQALEEAEQVLITHGDSLDEEKAQTLSRSLNSIVEQVIEEKLNLDAELLSFLKDSVPAEDVERSCCKPQPHCHGLRLLVIKEKVDFLGRAKFREEVCFEDDVTFKENVTINGNLNASTAAIGDITVVSLSATDAVIKNLSVTDLVVLSCIDDLCVDNLSVTDLVVLSCMDNLCVDNLSTTDVVANTMSVCDLTVTCDIFMNNSTSSAVGNVFKAGNRFIHNFGTENTFVGVNSGNFTMTATGNTAVGFNTLTAVTTGGSNVAVGANALDVNTTGIHNIAVGVNTLTNNTIGQNNVAIGDSALVLNTTGDDNVAVGNNAGFGNTTGIRNTAVGAAALNTCSTGSSNLALGFFAGTTLTTGSNNVYVASAAGAAAENNTIRVGNVSHTRYFAAGVRGVVTGIADAIPVLIDSAGQLGTVSSSKRFKHDIEDMNDISANIYSLRPVVFAYNGDASETRQYGLIAEEVDKVLPTIVVKDEDGKPYTVQYHVLPVLLLNEMQKLAARVAVLEARS